MSSSILSILLLATSGLVLFLYAVSRLALALRHVAGDRVKGLLGRFTRTIPAAILTGTIVTTLLDSSSVVIILAIALVSAGALPFRNSLGVVLGANIGTTISSQLFAFDLGQYAVVAMLPGLLLLSLSKKRQVRSAGRALFCFGLLFFSLFLIGEAAAPLKDYEGVRAWLVKLENPVRGAGAGALLTLILQSSSATLGMVIKLAGKGLLPLSAGIAVMLGAELGTCSDTLLATIGRGPAARKTGFFHLGFNLVSISLGLLLVNPFTDLVLRLAGSADVARQIAHAHVLFNVAGVLLFAPLLPFCQRLLAPGSPISPNQPKPRPPCRPFDGPPLAVGPLPTIRVPAYAAHRASVIGCAAWLFTSTSQSKRHVQPRREQAGCAHANALRAM